MIERPKYLPAVAQVDCMFTDRPALISHCAHIAVHPSGRWVYASVRGVGLVPVFIVMNLWAVRFGSVLDPIWKPWKEDEKMMRR